MDYLTSKDYMGVTRALQHPNGTLVRAQDTLTSAQGHTYEVGYISAPHKPGASGRIGVYAPGAALATEFYVAVFGLTWVAPVRQS